MASSEIHTFSPVAKTEVFHLHHIGEKITPNMEKLVQETRQEKIRLMREVFNSLTGKKLQIIEADQNASNTSNVILRDKNGAGLDRLGHGTEIQAVSVPGLKKPGINDNGYHFEEMTDNKGRKRIYVEVQTSSGKTGYVAMEHIGSIGQVSHVEEQKKPEEKQQEAQPTETEEQKKPEEKQQEAQPTETEEQKKPEEKQQEAQPTETEEQKKPEEKQQEAQPTETEEQKKPEEKQQEAQPTETEEQKKPEEKQQEAQPTETEEQKKPEEKQQEAQPTETEEQKKPEEKQQEAQPTETEEQKKPEEKQQEAQPTETEEQKKPEEKQQEAQPTETEEQKKPEEKQQEAQPTETEEQKKPEEKQQEAQPTETEEQKKPEEKQQEAQPTETEEQKKPEEKQQEAQPTETEEQKKPEEKQQEAQPTETEEQKKPEEKQQEAQPTETEEQKKPEEKQQEAQPTETEEQKKPEEKQQEAQPTETPEEAGKRMAAGILASIRANQNKDTIPPVTAEQNTTPESIPDTTATPVEDPSNTTKSKPWIIRGLDDLKKTDTPPITESNTETITPKETPEKIDPNPEIILVNNKIYQRRGIAPLYDYIEMYIDPKDKTLKSYSYIPSIKHHFPKEFSEGKVKSLSYQEASKLAEGKTDESGYIWIPETKNTAPENTPLLERKDKETLARELGSGLISTFNALALEQSLRDSVNGLLVDQSFNLRLDPSLENITDFTFNGKSIESKKGGKQEITGLEVQGLTLTIILKNGTKLSFAPPKG